MVFQIDGHIIMHPNPNALLWTMGTSFVAHDQLERTDQGRHQVER